MFPRKTSPHEPSDWMPTHLASAKLCMEDKQPDFTSLPPQLASLAAEIWALITSPRIQNLTRRQGEMELEISAVEDAITGQFVEWQSDTMISAMHMDGLHPDDKSLIELFAERTRLRNEVKQKAENTSRTHIRMAGLLDILTPGTGAGSHLASGQIIDMNNIYVRLHDVYTLEMNTSNQEKCLFHSSALLCQMEAELERCVVARSCSARSPRRPDKAKIGFRIHFANRLDGMCGSYQRLAELYQKKGAVEREMLAQYKKIAKRLATAVRIQAKQTGRGKA